jgi:hypothetical protein
MIYPGLKCARLSKYSIGLLEAIIGVEVFFEAIVSKCGPAVLHLPSGIPVGADAGSVLYLL